MDNEKTWRSIGEIVNEIIRTETEIRQSGGEVIRDPGDQEAFEILSRIERKILAKGLKP